MEIKELRAGNKVLSYAGSLPEIITVNGYALNYWGESTNRLGILGDVGGITLTEGILIKLGWNLDMEFENNTSYFTHTKYYAINKSEKGYELMINHEYWITIKVEYVHELQNAIWALSSFKKELEVNL